MARSQANEFEHLSSVSGPAPLPPKPAPGTTGTGAPSTSATGTPSTSATGTPSTTATGTPSATQGATGSAPATIPPSLLPPAKDSYSLSALSPALLPKLGPMDPKDRIDLYADPAIRSVDKMAQKDVTGPEASYQRSVKSLADSAKKDIADLQAQAAKLPAGSKERVAIEQKIDQRGDQFQRELESTTRFAQDQIKAKRGGEEGDKFAKSLPPYLQQCVKNKGVAIPGTNLGVVPRFDNGGVTGGPTGVSIGGKF